MTNSPLNVVMNKLYAILESNSIENIVNQLVRHASVEDRTTAMLALCSLLMIENTRRLHADRRCSELEEEIEKLQRKYDNLEANLK